MQRLREPVNGLTHLAGALLALVALGVLIGMAVAMGKVRHLVAFLIFGMSLVGLYTSSALYHLLPLSARGIARLRRLDHIMIFFLIAGTYTPFGLIALHGGWRWGILGTVWGLAIAGDGDESGLDACASLAFHRPLFPARVGRDSGVTGLIAGVACGGLLLAHRWWDHL